MTSENGWYTEEAGMAQLDDIVGAIMRKIKDLAIDDNTIVIFTTDNGAEVFTWPDGGMTPFAGAKGTVLEGGMRVPAIIRWPGKVPPGKIENQLMSGLDWFPTLVAAAGNPDIIEELKNGKKLNDRTFKVHLDGYNQMGLITGKAPSKRSEVWYFAESKLGAVRIKDWKYRFLDQPEGWLGSVVTLNWPLITNLRLDPFERTTPDKAPPAFLDFMGHEFWRYVFVQQKVAELGESFVQFPPMQRGASFNLEEVKQQIVEQIQRRGQ